MNGGKAGMGLDSSRLMEGALRPAELQRKLEKRNRWPVTNKSHQISDGINCSFVVTDLPVVVHQ